MATLTEDHVTVEVTLTTDTTGAKHVFLSGQSFDASGVSLRSYTQLEVTNDLTPTQQSEALDLLNAATAYLKTLWGIA